MQISAGFSLSHTFMSDSIDYDANLRLIRGPVLADFFPAASFVPVQHLTAGKAKDLRFHPVVTGQLSTGSERSKLFSR